MRRAVACVAALVFAGALTLPAGAAELSIVAAPGSFELGYATRALIVPAGSTLSFVNGDIDAHAVESEAFGPDSSAWCGPVDPGKPEGPFNPRAYPMGKCPLFWSPTTIRLDTRAVLGVDRLKAGRAYGFFCRRFPETMAGVLLAT